jgi:hypothetical protein
VEADHIEVADIGIVAEDTLDMGHVPSGRDTADCFCSRQVPVPDQKNEASGKGLGGTLGRARSDMDQDLGTWKRQKKLAALVASNDIQSWHNPAARQLRVRFRV